MAELTNLESELGEVVGLAMAAQEAGQNRTASLALASEEDPERNVLELARPRREARFRQRASRTAGRAADEPNVIPWRASAICTSSRALKIRHLTVASVISRESAISL